MLARFQDKYKEHLLLRSFLGVGGMYMLSVPLGLAINILLARQLGPAEFGQYVFVISMLALLVLPVSGGLPQLLTREVARLADAGQWGLYRGAIRAAHAWVVIVSIIVMAIYYLLHSAGIIPAESKWALLSIVILLVPLQGLNAVRNGAIKGLGFPALAEMPLQTIQPLLYLSLLGVLSLTATMSVAQALWAQVVVAAITFLIATGLFQKISPGAARTFIADYRVFDWLRSLLPFTLISLVGTFNAQVVIVLLGLMGTDEAVGVLRVADRGAQFVSLTLMLINMVISPYIVKACRSNNKYDLQKLSRRSARAAFLVAMPIGLLLVVFGSSIIDFAFGDEYGEAAYIPLTILVVGQLYNVALGSVGILLVMSGHEKMTLLGQLVGLLATIIPAVILIPDHGVVGASLAISFGLVAWNSAMGIAVRKYLKISPGIL